MVAGRRRWSGSFVFSPAVRLGTVVRAMTMERLKLEDSLLWRDEEAPVEAYGFLSVAFARAEMNAQETRALLGWLAIELYNDQYAQLDNAGRAHEERIQLSQVFIDLTVSTTAPGERIERSGKEEGSKFVRTVLETKRRTQVDVRRAWDGEDRCQGYVLFGGPGQGKSTLGQFICQAHRAALLAPHTEFFAEGIRHAIKSFSGEKLAARLGSAIKMSECIPLRIELTRLAQWLAERKNAIGSDKRAGEQTLLDYIVLEKIRLSGELAVSSSKLSALIVSCPWVIVLDGLDEVFHEEERKNILKVVRDFLKFVMSQQQGGLVVGTTRPQGYTNEFDDLGLSLKPLHILPLNDREVLQYSESLVKARIPDENRREVVSERITKALRNETTERLMRSPLHITILQSLIAGGGDFPIHRWELFEEYYRAIFRRERDRVGAASEILQHYSAFIDALHRTAGLYLQVKAQRAGQSQALLPRALLERFVMEMLAERGYSQEEQKEGTKKIVAAAGKRLVLLVERQTDQFGFEVTPFREFMAAWAIDSRYKEMAQLHERIKLVAKSPHFWGVLLFVASRASRTDSTLYEFFTDKLVPWMNDDAEDELSRTVKAGSMLALEILEDGSAATFPTYETRLMHQACKLLDFALPNVHVRLGRVAARDAKQTLRAEIEARGLETAGYLGAWASLLVMVDKGEPWAPKYADATWKSAVGFRKSIVEAAAGARRDNGAWISKRIRTSLEEIPPWVVQAVAEKDTNQRGHHTERRILRIVQAFAEEGAISGEVQRNGERLLLRYLFKSVRPDLYSTSAKLIADIARPPPMWRPIAAAARFLKQPSADMLAKTLRWIADAFNLRAVRWAAKLAPWPLGACLSVCTSPEHLHALANDAQNKAFGDFDGWVVAEARWHSKKLEFKEFIHRPLLGEGSARDAAMPGLSRELALRGAAIHGLDTLFDKNKDRVADLNRTIRALIETLGSLYGYSRNTLAALGLKLLVQGAEVDRMWVASISRADIEALWGHILPEDDIHDEAILSPTLHHLLPASETRAAREVEDIKALAAVDIDPADVERIAAQILSREDVTARSLRLVLARIAKMALNPEVRENFLLALARNTPEGRYDLSREIAVAVVGLFNKRRSEIDDPSIWDQAAFPSSARPERGPVSVPPPVQLDQSPVQVQTIVLKDVRVFDELSISPVASKSAEDGQWIVILGENGYGKTTLLRSLALALLDIKEPNAIPSKAFSASSPWLRSRAHTEDAGAARTTSDTSESGDEPTADILIELRDGNFRTTIRHNLITGEEYPSQGVAPFLQRPLVFAYGCRRGSALGGNAREVTYERPAEIATLFDERADLVHAETWLKDLFLAKAYEKEGGPATSLVDAVCSVLVSVLPGVAGIEYDPSSRSLFVVGDEAQGDVNIGRIPLAAMSDGYLTTTGWVLDLIARWVDIQERRNVLVEGDFTKTMTGLVLVDEIDLHLHPRWQKDVIRRVKEVFPKMSFVVTTHNPLTLLGARPEEIFVLRRTEEGRIVAEPGVQSPMLLTASQILSAYFGITSLFPNELGAKLRRYGFLAANPVRTDKEDAEMQRLRDELAQNDIHPGWEPVHREEIGGLS